LTSSSTSDGTLFAVVGYSSLDTKDQGLKFDEMVSSSSSNSSEEESFNQEDQLDELLLNESDDDDDQLLESSNHNKEVEVTSDVFTNAPFISTNSAKSFSSIQTKDQTAPNPQPTSSTNPFDSAPFPSTKPLSKDIFGSSPFLPVTHESAFNDDFRPENDHLYSSSCKDSWIEDKLRDKKRSSSESSGYSQTNRNEDNPFTKDLFGLTPFSPST